MRYLILINHSDVPVQVALPTMGKAILGDLRHNELPAHGVALWAMPRSR